MAKTKSRELLRRLTPELRELLEKVPAIADDIIQICLNSTVGRPMHRFTLYDFQRDYEVPLVSALASDVLKQELEKRAEVKRLCMYGDNLEITLTDQAKKIVPEVGAEME